MSTETRPAVSIVIPAYNERDCIPLLERELVPVASELGAEILIVDNGSTDGSRQLYESNPAFRYHFIAKPSKSEALRVGYEMARGDIVVTIDADMQEDPAHIRDMVRMVSNGIDMTHGQRQQRADGLFHKRVPSFFYNLVIAVLFFRYFRDINCGLRVSKRGAVSGIPWFEGCHRLIPLLVSLKGRKVVGVPVRHQERRAGDEKFGSKGRFFKGLWDLVRVRLELV